MNEEEETKPMAANSFPESFDDYMRNLWRSFLATFGALQLFAVQLPTVADNLDNQIIDELAEVMADVFGDPIEQVRDELREFLPSLDEDHLYPDFYNQPDVRAIFAEFKNTSFQRRVLRWLGENPRKSHRFLFAWADYMAQPPMSGIVLRQSALINLASALEIFVDALIKGYGHYQSPDKKVEELHSWKMRWKKLDEILCSDVSWHRFRSPLMEMIARRNVLVHQGGKIDDTYLKYAPENYHPKNAEIDRFILVPTTYLQETFDTVILFVFALSQSAWHTWQQSQTPKHVSEITKSFIYQVLRQEKYRLVVELAQIAIQFKMHWADKQYVLINWAIALRQQNDLDGMRLILAKLEGKKKRAWQIEIAVNILRKNNTKARSLMLAAAKKNQLKEISPYWPLFEPVRDQTWFKNMFAVKYGDLPKKQ